MDVAGTSADYGADTEHCSVGGEKLMLFLRSSTLDDRVLRPLSNLRHQQLPACDYKTLDTLEHVDAVPAIPRHLRVLAPISAEQDGILASAAKTSIVEPSRLPIVYAPPKTPRYALDDIDNIVYPLDLAGDGDGDAWFTQFRGGGTVADIGPVGLDDVQRLVVFVCQRCEGSLEVRQSCCGAVERVETEAEDLDEKETDISTHLIERVHLGADSHPNPKSSPGP